MQLLNRSIPKVIISLAGVGLLIAFVSTQERQRIDEDGTIQIQPEEYKNDTEVNMFTLDKICSQEKHDIKISKCNDFYATYPLGFIADAPTKIFDSEGNYTNISCGGYTAFISEKAREERRKACNTILKNCTIVLNSCQKLVQ